MTVRVLFAKLVAQATVETCDTKSFQFEYVMEMLDLGYWKLLEAQEGIAYGTDYFCGLVICKLLREVASMQNELQGFKNAASSSPSSSDSGNGEDNKQPKQHRLQWKRRAACQACDVTEYASIENERHAYTCSRIMLSTRTAELQNMHDLTKIKQPDAKFRARMTKKTNTVAKLAAETARLYKNCQERMTALEERAKSEPNPRRNIKRTHEAVVHVQEARKMLRTSIERLDKASHNLEIAG